MNASKTLIAAIAAASIVGTVGFVSAQTSDSNAPAAQSTEPMPSATTTPQDSQQAPATAPADMSSPPYVAPQSDSSMPSSSAAPAADATSTPSPALSSDSSMPAEPAPKADRN
jgi:hypothetical protein